MESHHHRQQQQQSSHHCASCYCTCSPSPRQPQLSPSDQLLQAIASQLLQQQHYIHKPHQQQPQKPHQHQSHKHHHVQQQALFASLLRRIETLESSLHQLSPTIRLRDTAARTIQTHFRAYLVRRSQTLRNLKLLTLIKSSFNSLKSSISSKPHFNPQSLSQKAINLLRRLDSIQGGDPMIRDGKRAISRELVQFLEYIDGVLMKRQQLYSKSVNKVRFRLKNPESTRAYKCTHEQSFSDDLDDQGGSSDDQRELMENLCKKIDNIEGFSRVYENEEQEPQIETDGSSSSKLSNNGEGSSRDHLRSEVNYGNDNHWQGQNENLFSAPLPVQMEPIRDNLMKREKIVRVAW